MNYQPLLFEPEKKSKTKRLLEWIKEKKYVRTSEIIRWGVENYCNDADRRARQFGEDGIIRRLTKEEVFDLFGAEYKEKVWKYDRPNL